MKSFNPNKNTFSGCLERLIEAKKKVNFPKEGIITSKDKVTLQAMDVLKVDNIPNGFNKWQLPVYLDGASQMFITVGDPETKVPTHSHDEGDGIRFIISGSILYNDVELTAGDWMFIPAGEKYDFVVGRYGVTMSYCYQCCCA